MNNPFTEVIRGLGQNISGLLTGENPLFSIDYANRVADTLKKGKSDFVYIEGLPIGCAVYGLRTKATRLVCQIKEETDTEIWGLLLNQPDIFEVTKIVAEPEFRYPKDLRITLDYIEDYLMIKEIFAHLRESNEVPSYLDVIRVLQRNPDICAINEQNQQLALDPKLIEKINQFYKDNRERILRLKDEIYS